jgi:hypothetical protein
MCRAKGSADAETHSRERRRAIGAHALASSMEDMAGLVRGGLQQARCCASPEGRVCLPLLGERPYSSSTPPDPDLHVCVSHAQTRPETPMAWGTRAEMRPPDKRGLFFYWLASVMRDTVMQHHHGQHTHAGHDSIDTLGPRIADLRNAAGIVYTLGFVRFGQVVDCVPFAMRRREGRRWSNCWRLYRPRNQLSRSHYDDGCVPVPVTTGRTTRGLARRCDCAMP